MSHIMFISYRFIKDQPQSDVLSLFLQYNIFDFVLDIKGMGDDTSIGSYCLVECKSIPLHPYCLFFLLKPMHVQWHHYFFKACFQFYFHSRVIMGGYGKRPKWWIQLMKNGDNSIDDKYYERSK